jgi:hypothetical protein
MMAELDIVVLKQDLPAEGLRAGDVGTIVMVYDDGKAYEVEFTALTGETVSVVTVPASAIRPAESTDVTHARAAVA